MKIEKKLNHHFNSWILAGTYFRYPGLVPARIPAHVPAWILSLFYPAHVPTWIPARFPARCNFFPDM